MNVTLRRDSFQHANSPHYILSRISRNAGSTRNTSLSIFILFHGDPHTHFPYNRAAAAIAATPARARGAAAASAPEVSVLLELLVEAVEEPEAEAELDLVPVEVAVDSSEAEPESEEGPVAVAEAEESVVVVIPELAALSVALEADSEAVLVTPPYADSKEDRRLA